MGTIVGLSDLDPLRWPASKWRSLQVNNGFSMSFLLYHDQTSRGMNIYTYRWNGMSLAVVISKTELIHGKLRPLKVFSFFLL